MQGMPASDGVRPAHIRSAAGAALQEQEPDSPAGRSSTGRSKTICGLSLICCGGLHCASDALVAPWSALGRRAVESKGNGAVMRACCWVQLAQRGHAAVWGLLSRQQRASLGQAVWGRPAQHMHKPAAAAAVMVNFRRHMLSAPTGCLLGRCGPCLFMLLVLGCSAPC